MSMECRIEHTNQPANRNYQAFLKDHGNAFKNKSSHNYMINMTMECIIEHSNQPANRNNQAFLKDNGNAFRNKSHNYLNNIIRCAVKMECNKKYTDRHCLQVHHLYPRPDQEIHQSFFKLNENSMTLHKQIITLKYMSTISCGVKWNVSKSTNLKKHHLSHSKY